VKQGRYQYIFLYGHRKGRRPSARSNKKGWSKSKGRFHPGTAVHDLLKTEITGTGSLGDTLFTTRTASAQRL